MDSRAAIPSLVAEAAGVGRPAWPPSPAAFLRLAAVRDFFASLDRRALLIISISKLMTLLVLALAYFFMPFSVIERAGNEFIYPAEGLESVSLTSHFATWDSSHYLFLADEGYKPEQKSNAFAPFYPLSIRALDQILGNS